MSGEHGSEGALEPSKRSRSKRPHPEQRPKSAPPKLLDNVAAGLRELERVARDAASGLREQAFAARLHEQPASGSGRAADAVLHELILTLSERANGLEREAELIAGILERARDAIKHPDRTRAHRGAPVPGRLGKASERPASAGRGRAGNGNSGRLTAPEAPGAQGDTDPPRKPASAGVKLLAAQMALDGQSDDAIRLRLKREFGVTDAAGAVREVLGGATRS